MKNLKKVLSVLLVVAMLATAMVPAFAAETFTYETQAKALYDIGLFKGTSTTEFVPELGGDLTREQGIAMIVRLLGKADAAAAVAAADQDKALAAFADAKDVEATLKATLAYAVKNGLVKGDGTSVNPKGKMLGKDFATILLRNLGYEVAAADYDKASATLAEKGGLTAAQAVKFNDKELIRDDFVGMSYGALSATYKTGETVIAKLITDKVVTEDAAVKANIITKAVVNVTAKATGAKKITVNFGAAVDTSKVTVTVKKGTVANTVAATTWATDKKSAVVELSSKLTAGDYTVSVAGLADKATDVKVTAADEKVEKIVFDSDKAVIERAATNEGNTVRVSYTIYNQYNEDVTKAYYANSAMSYNVSQGDLIERLNGVLRIKKNTSDSTKTYTVGQDTVFVTILNSDSGAFASSTLSVVNRAQVAEVAIEKLYNEDNDTLEVTSNFEDFKLLFKFKDQYGNDITTATYIADDVSISTSDDDVVEFDEVSNKPNFKTEEINDEDVVTLALAKPTNNDAGTSTVRVISKTTGKVATLDVVVKDTIKTETFTMQIPELAVAGEKVKIPFTAVDQFGNEITDVEDLANVDIDSDLDTDEAGKIVTVEFVQNPVTDKPEMILDLTRLSEEATVSINTWTDGFKSNSKISVTVEEKAKPTTITGLSSSFLTKVVTDGKAALAYDKFTVKDQYSRDIPAFKMRNELMATPVYTVTGTTVASAAVTTTYLDGQYRFVVTTSNPAKIDVIGKTNVTKLVSGIPTAVASTYAIVGNTDKVYLYGAAEGSATITVQMQENVSGTWTDIEDCDYDFTMAAIDLSDIAKFEINTPSKTLDVQKLTASQTGGAGDYVVAPTKNSYALSNAVTTDATSYDRGITVTGILADGSKVTVPYQLGRSVSSSVYAYEVMTAYQGVNVFFDKSTTTENGTDSTVYNKELRVFGLTDDEDEVVVPFVVTVKGKTTVSLNGTLTVVGENPKITALTSSSNRAVAATGANTVVVKKSLLDNIYANTTLATAAEKEAVAINTIVAEAVKAVDQYGAEHGSEYNKIAFYKFEATNKLNSDDTTATIIKDSGDSFTVTVFSTNNAQAITLTVVID